MLEYQLMLVGSILLMLGLTFLIVKKKKKKQIHYAVMGIAISLLSWNMSVFLLISYPQKRWMSIICEKTYFVSIILVSLAILFAGLIYSRNKIRFSWKYGMIFVVPVILLIALFTNSYHHLFYSTFSLIPSEQDFGFFYTIHTIYAYLCTGVGLYYFLSFAVKNFGFFSRQALIVFFAVLLALAADSLSTLHIVNWSAAVENVIFSVTTILLILAIIKYDFLNIAPIALHKVIDVISDFYVVFGESSEIIDFNNGFLVGWSGVRRGREIGSVIEENCPGFDKDYLETLIHQSIREKTKVSLEIKRPSDMGEIYYQGEITPVFSKGSHIGTILLIKDVTEQKKNLEEVIRLNEKLQSLATKDGLTQAYNRYYFDERLEQEIELLGKRLSDDKATGDNLGLIMFDIDHFKIYNDLNGHPSGDELLKTLVKIVKEALSTEDVLCRYGGEEFAVICCNTVTEGIGTVAEKIRKAVEGYEFEYQNTMPGGRLTVSVGAAGFRPTCQKKDDLIRKADQNLYQAKNEGRNKIIFD